MWIDREGGSWWWVGGIQGGVVVVMFEKFGGDLGVRGCLSVIGRGGGVLWMLNNE